MYLKRKFDDYLLSWKNNENKKPLIVKGARQIGKTRTIRHFAENNYKNVIEINFAEQKKFFSICDDGYEVESIIKNISRIEPRLSFIPKQTLIFFDELQDFPQIATSLKFFNQDKNYDVICSGSLLGISYQKIESNSVGNKTDYNLSSLDFEEFLWAKGYDKNIRTDFLEHLINVNPFSTTEMKVFMDLFFDYCILGGMPKVITTFLENKSFEGVLPLQCELISDYKEDIRKYVTGLDQTRILNVFNQIPIQLAKENKKFQISKIAKGSRFKDYWGCIEWLNDSGIINVCRCLKFPELPLKGNYDENKYKIYFRDTGLLIACLDEEAQDDLRANKNLDIYKGALYENIIADGLVKEGYDLFYYKREASTLEQDFFVRTKNTLVPVEVKSKNNRSKSLRTLISSENYHDIKNGIKLCSANLGFENNIFKIPYFCTFLLKDFLREVDW